MWGREADLSALLAAIAARAVQRPQWARDCLRLVDRDRDGLVTREECAQFVEGFELPRSAGFRAFDLLAAGGRGVDFTTFMSTFAPVLESSRRGSARPRSPRSPGRSTQGWRPSSASSARESAAWGPTFAGTSSEASDMTSLSARRRLRPSSARAPAAQRPLGPAPGGLLMAAGRRPFTPRRSDLLASGRGGLPSASPARRARPSTARMWRAAMASRQPELSMVSSSGASMFSTGSFGTSKGDPSLFVESLQSFERDADAVPMYGNDWLRSERHGDRWAMYGPDPGLVMRSQRRPSQDYVGRSPRPRPPTTRSAYTGPGGSATTYRGSFSESLQLTGPATTYRESFGDWTPDRQPGVISRPGPPRGRWARDPAIAIVDHLGQRTYDMSAVSRR